MQSPANVTDHILAQGLAQGDRPIRSPFTPHGTETDQGAPEQAVVVSGMSKAFWAATAGGDCQRWHPRASSPARKWLSIG